MKFDVFNWVELDPSRRYVSAAGRLRLKLDRPAAVYVSCQGVQALLGFGTEFDYKIGEEYEVEIKGPAALRVFAWEGEKAFHEAEGEVFSNVDRRPLESGSVLEVTAALRQMKLAHREMMRDLQTARQAARPAAAPAPEPDAPTEGEGEDQAATTAE